MSRRALTFYVDTLDKTGDLALIRAWKEKHEGLPPTLWVKHDRSCCEDES
jgi:hypothetical protein